MTYDEAITLLQNNHFYPAKKVKVGKKSSVCEGLEITCPPILKDERIKRVKEVLGEEGFSYDWLPNEQALIVKIK